MENLRTMTAKIPKRKRLSNFAKIRRGKKIGLSEPYHVPEPEQEPENFENDLIDDDEGKDEIKGDIENIEEIPTNKPYVFREGARNLILWYPTLIHIIFETFSAEIHRVYPEILGYPRIPRIPI